MARKITPKERARREFVEEALHRGYACAPKTLVTHWFGQQKFSKGIPGQLKNLAEDEEIYSEAASSIHVFVTPMNEILLVREMKDWVKEI